MPELSFAPVRTAAGSLRTTAASLPSTATATMTRATRRVTRRRRTRREAIGAWWRSAKVALRLTPPRRRATDAPIPQIAAAAAGAGAGAVMLMAIRRRVSRRAAYLEGRITGAVHEIRSTETPPEDDRTLTDKVRTEIFRRPDAPKGSVNVSAVDGIVYLRGEVSSSDEIQRLIDDALAVTGVLRVESLLHTTGTAAPTGGAG